MWIIDNLWNTLKEMGIPDHLTYLLRNLYAGQEAEPDIEQQTGSNWERSSSRLYIAPCLFNLYAVYIMRNPGLDEAQAGIKIARRDINNLRYADSTTLMAESKEELKGLLMKVKEERGKSWLKIQHSEN